MQDREQPTEPVDERLDLEAAQFRSCWVAVASTFEGRDGIGAFGLDLGDPAGDDGRVCAGLEGSAVASELAVAGHDGLLQRIRGGRVVGLRLFQRGEGGLHVVGVEGGGEPAIERGEDRVLTDVDGQGMIDVIGEGVFLGVAASVVGVAVVPVALHAPTALLVEQQAAQSVGMLCARCADAI
ncbi:MULTISPECIES: hypothetical protein [unclassified Pseudofrankia]|uniref:hypothetical protein n=1 Tax=unclassified Pseudofrankia TaxID=2994372 RepID=UPI001F51A578|nr:MULTISPECIES: hypothetical protein [unclassified Pseudofrankia]MDT3443031.1 hypothetical protein [Pseudofrankia sp. BMG5.37]